MIFCSILHHWSDWTDTTEKYQVRWCNSCNRHQHRRIKYKRPLRSDKVYRRIPQIIAVLALVIFITGVGMALPAQTRTQPAYANEKDPAPPNPYRPSFDMWGNQWSYDGKLLHAVCPNVPDPITGKDNPECKVVKKPAPKPTTKSVQSGVCK